MQLEQQFGGYSQAERGSFQIAGGVPVPRFQLTSSDEDYCGTIQLAKILRDDMFSSQDVSFPEISCMVNGKKTSNKIAAVQCDQLREQQMMEFSTTGTLDGTKESKVDVISHSDNVIEGIRIIVFPPVTWVPKSARMFLNRRG